MKSGGRRFKEQKNSSRSKKKTSHSHLRGDEQHETDPEPETGFLHVIAQKERTGGVEAEWTLPKELVCVCVLHAECHVTNGGRHGEGAVLERVQTPHRLRPSVGSRPPVPTETGIKTEIRVWRGCEELLIYCTWSFCSDLVFFQTACSVYELPSQMCVVKRNGVKILGQMATQKAEILNKGGTCPLWSKKHTYTHIRLEFSTLGSIIAM